MTVDNTKLDFWGDKIGKNEIGGTCRAYGREEGCVQGFGGEA